MAFVAQILLVFSICFISVVISNEYVPVNIWGMSKSSSPLPALGRMNEEFFRDILLEKLNKDKVVLVFLEENLSPEDLSTSDSTGNNLYKHLSYLRKELHMNYYPFVEGPLKAVQHLPGVKFTTVSVTEDGLPDGTNVEPGEVLIVDLNDAKDNEDRNQMLKRHDSIIGSIYKSFAKKFKNHLVTIYTAKHSSWVVPSELDENSQGRKVRHLMEVTPTADSTNGKLINGSNYMIYVSDTITITTDKTMNFTNCEKSSTADINDLIVTLKCNVSGTTKDDALKLTFGDNLGYWYLKSVYNPELNVTFKITDVFAPYKFSYHCDISKYLYEDATDPSKVISYTLSLPGLQVERFRNSTGTDSPSAFNYAYDCVGFTTAPIWSGIFVTFILALIMTFGLCMIMDIKTMDRFDDPKGKTISINVVE